VVLANKVDNYTIEARKQGFTVKRFTYDIQKYREEQELKTRLEHKMETLKVRT